MPKYIHISYVHVYDTASLHHFSHASRRRSSTVCSTSWMTWPLDERKPITVSVKKKTWLMDDCRGYFMG